MVAAGRDTREEALARYRRERPAFERLAAEVASGLRSVAGQHGIPCTVTSRAKEVSSFSKKMITKGYQDPWREVTDKAGVRVTTLYARDVPRLRDLVIARYPDPMEVKDFAAQLEAHRLGYQGIHVTVATGALATDGGDSEPCEVQIRTFAQGTWAEVSHHLMYKPESELSETVARRLYRLVALMELFDSEVEAAMSDLATLDGHAASRLLSIAEAEFYRYCSADFHRDLSMMVLGDLLETISSDLEAYAAQLHSFASAHDDRLQELLARYADDPMVPLLSQPEAIVIIERLEVDPDALRDAWRSLPFDVLEDIESAWGYDVY